VPLPMGSRRVLAFLSLQDRAVLRGYVAGALWPDTSEDRAQANLRSALWRLRRSGLGVVEANAVELRASPSLDVDVVEATALAHRLVGARESGEDLDSSVAARARALLTTDLLADWYDDWIIVARERFRQLRLHALEALSAILTAKGSFGEAADAALAAIAGEPLRESAHRSLIGVHLAEGNRGEALGQYERYRELLRRELGVDPSEQMRRLVRDAVE